MAPTICKKVRLCSGKSERSVRTEGSEMGLERQVEDRLESLQSQAEKCELHDTGDGESLKFS